jgi:HAD superfamily hydrolase (TIGR01509 family)
MYRGVILDIDGTLVDTNDAHAHAWKEALSNHGYNIPYERIRSLMGMGGDNLLSELLHLPKDDERTRYIGQERKDIFVTRFLPQVQALPATREFVSRLLDAGIKVVIATSAEPDEASRLLQIANVDDLVDEPTGLGEVKNSKPDPDAVQVALQKLNLAPNEAVMIGDTPYDIEAAKKAGVKTIVVRTGGFTDAQLKGAVAIYNDLADLLAQFDGSPLMRH